MISLISLWSVQVGCTRQGRGRVDCGPRPCARAWPTLRGLNACQLCDPVPPCPPTHLLPFLLYSSILLFSLLNGHPVLTSLLCRAEAAFRGYVPALFKGEPGVTYSLYISYCECSFFLSFFLSRLSLSSRVLVSVGFSSAQLQLYLHFYASLLASLFESTSTLFQSSHMCESQSQPSLRCFALTWQSALVTQQAAATRNWQLQAAGLRALPLSSRSRCRGQASSQGQ